METQLTREIARKDIVEQNKQTVSAKSQPSIPDELGWYSNPIWVIMTNKTQFDITSVDQFFNHGTFDRGTASCSPWNLSTFGMRNVTHWYYANIGWGVGGAISFSARMDEHHIFEFSVDHKGFENPRVGTYAAQVVQGHDRKDAYNQAYNKRDGNTITSEKYKGKNKDDDEERFQLSITVTAGQTMYINVSQDPL